MCAPTFTKTAEETRESWMFRLMSRFCNQKKNAAMMIMILLLND